MHPDDRVLVFWLTLVIIILILIVVYGDEIFGRKANEIVSPLLTIVIFILSFIDAMALITQSTP